MPVAKMNKRRVFVRTVFCLLMLPVTMPAALASVSPGEDAGSFYRQIFEKGRMHYRNGQLNEALSKFKIAEFGLHENPQELKRIYHYCLAIFLRQRRMDSLKTSYERFKVLFPQERIHPSTAPEELNDEMEKLVILIRKDLWTSENWDRRIRYEWTFYNTVTGYDSLTPAELEKRQALLEGLNPSDFRRRLIEGLVDYSRGKYRQALKKLGDVRARSLVRLPEVADRIWFVMGMAHYHTGEYEKIMEIIQKIDERDLISRLQQKIREMEKNL